MISSLSQEDVPTYKVILLGKSAAGKTKLLIRYLYQTYEDAGNVTVMVDCSFRKRGECRFAYYDTAGQEAYRSILNLYFKGTDAALLIYNLSDVSTFKELSFYYQKVKEELPNCLIYLVGCKGDLDRDVSDEQVRSGYPAKNYFITSAKTNEGVQEAFHTIEKDLMSKRKVAIGRSLISKFEVEKDKKKKQKMCCK